MRVGEVWVGGPNVARGYWRNPRPARRASQAQDRRRGRNAGCAPATSASSTQQAGLFVTGRIKDWSSSGASITIRRISSGPSGSASGTRRKNGGAVFAVPDEGGEEELVVVQEVERTGATGSTSADMNGRIREEVTEQHEMFARQWC